jgi:hypothetical protein
LVVRHRVDAHTLHHVAQIEGRSRVDTTSRGGGGRSRVDGTVGGRRGGGTVDARDGVGSVVAGRSVVSVDKTTGDTARGAESDGAIRLGRLMRRPGNRSFPLLLLLPDRSIRCAVNRCARRGITVLKGRNGTNEGGVEFRRDGGGTGEAEGGGVDVHLGRSRATSLELVGKLDGWVDGEVGRRRRMGGRGSARKTSAREGTKGGRLVTRVFQRSRRSAPVLLLDGAKSRKTRRVEMTPGRGRRRREEVVLGS